ncbi:hypothetical protein LJC43_07330, partial [Parabacteroides sp. OttesenSCG-928-G21]|nr:hypothetical protein [Parabacteroides sp. OttesenSCG-928-G21]
MANKERIDHLLLEIRELEKQIAAVRDSEFYPVSFFSQTFVLAHKVITELHAIEADQLAILRRQLEEHQQLINSLPITKPETTPQQEDLFKEKETEEISPALEKQSVAMDQNIELEPVLSAEESLTEEESEESVVIEQAVQPFGDAKEKAILADKKATIFLNEILEKKTLSDFRKAFSLNDRFRYKRELFGGDEEKMNKALSDLNEIQTYEDSITYLHTELNWNIEDESVTEFISFL